MYSHSNYVSFNTVHTPKPLNFVLRRDSNSGFTLIPNNETSIPPIDATDDLEELLTHIISHTATKYPELDISDSIAVLQANLSNWREYLAALPQGSIQSDAVLKVQSFLGDL
jgi:hypothetical protein